MKRFFTTILIVLISFSLFCNPVSKKDAQLIAEKFYAVQSNIKAGGFTIKDAISYDFEGEASMYIFSFSTGGFVLVSADDVEIPVLGYSLTSPIKKDITNKEIKYFFDILSNNIKQAKTAKSENQEIKDLWDRYSKGDIQKSVAVVNPLLTTTWDQSPRYNNLCPTGTPTGCVATAMAQIMNFHEWPASGQGWHKYIPSDKPGYGIQYADFGSVNYDWQQMPNELNSLSSMTEIDAISTLMYHCGVSVDMNYDTDGSGAFSQDVMYALTNYFKYDPTTIDIYGLTTSNQATFLSKIKTDLDQNQPVYYSGSGADGGHAWVCDGYDASNNLHINWGWGGAYNGYFVVTGMTPNTTYSFTQNNLIITGIKPGQVQQDILWTKQASGFLAQSRGIQFISAVNRRVAWAVAYDGSGSQAKVKDYTRTVDGGATWNSGTISLSGTTDYSAAMISAVNDKKAWVALFGPSGGGKIVKTSDGGATWVHQSTATFASPAGFPNVVHFWDENNGFCMGDPNGGYFEIYTTTNGGDSWSRVPSANIPNEQSGEYGTTGFYAVYGNTVWFATNMGRIFKSTDKGYNWVVYQTPITDASFELTFRDANNGVIQKRATGAVPAYKTLDGGQTWAPITTAGSFYTSSLRYIPGTNLLLSTGVSTSTAPYTGVSYSTDDGSTFTDYADFYKNYQFLALGASGEDGVWAGGFNSSQYADGMWHLGTTLIAASFSANKTNVNKNDSTIIFTESSYGSPESWEWNFGAGASPQTLTGKGPHRIKYTTEESKTITLTITKGSDEHIFVRENYVWVTGPVDVTTPENDKQISIYPNPAKTIINLSGFEKGIIKIYSTSGSIIWESNGYTNDNTLDISNLNEGLYIIKIETPDRNVITKKLTIQK